jgi:predicted benzoate:H+ symporter BenE
VKFENVAQMLPISTMQMVAGIAYAGIVDTGISNGKFEK